MVSWFIYIPIQWFANASIQQNWDAYRRELEAEQIAKANEMTATESQMDWDWGLWAIPTQGGPP
jgi:hypothetical protein